MATPAVYAIPAEEGFSARAVRALVLALSGLAAAVGTGWIVGQSTLVEDPAANALLRSLLVACYAAVGAYTWWRRPGTRLGPVVAGLGFVYALASLSAIDEPVPFAIGRLAVAAQGVYFAYLFIAFPHDRLKEPFERRFFATVAGASALVWAFVLVFSSSMPRAGPLTSCGQGCPGNALRLVDTSAAVTSALNVFANAATAVMLAAILCLLVIKATSRGILYRRAVAPLVAPAVLLWTGFVAFSLTGAFPTFFAILVAIGGFGVPLALLVGQVQSRVFATTSLAQFAASGGRGGMTPVAVQSALKIILHDPSIALAVWDRGHGAYLDVYGRPFPLPRPTPDRTVTLFTRADRPALALVHDSLLADDADVLDGLGAVSSMLLENTSLVDALQASRARIVESAERERLRLERDLHDGAQQRLLAMQVKLELARQAAGPGALADELEGLAAEASNAVDELRSLAHGIYPSVLRERGLGDALRSVAMSSALPVTVADDGVGRFSAATESAVYYCALEAIQNAVKHAGPDARATVSLRRSPGGIEFEVADDGVGFDSAANGQGDGVVNMKDRIGAVGGTVYVHAELGRGTRVSGFVPAADPGR